MTIQDCKPPRELLPLQCKTSKRWHNIRLAIVFIFCNLTGFALLPYLLGIFSFPSANLLSSCLMIGLNILMFIVMRQRLPFRPVEYELACKQGIWKVIEGSRVNYARLVGDIVVWQWIIIIHLKFPQGKCIQLMLLEDSMSSVDMATLRRWLVSEFH